MLQCTGTSIVSVQLGSFFGNLVDLKSVCTLKYGGYVIMAYLGKFMKILTISMQHCLASEILILLSISIMTIPIKYLRKYISGQVFWKNKFHHKHNRAKGGL